MRTPNPARPDCGVCHSEGFYARPCPACKNQRPLDRYHARVYGLPEGTLRPVPPRPEEEARR